MELEHSLSEIRRQGLGLAAISYDAPAVLKNFADRMRISFPLLSDPESKIIRAFGIFNEKTPNTSPAYGIPHPGTYLLDSHGVVTAKYFEDDYTQRFTAADILTRQFGIKLGVEHTTVETKHLRLASSASMTRVRTGQRVALVLDIDLKSRMHAYAPGVEGYFPVNWTIADSTSAAVHEVVFPKSEKLRLKAIRETVPVYKGHIRLVRDITISKNAPPEFALVGTLRYQACDDKTCYIPESVPLKWTFSVEPHDRERVPEDLRRKAKQ